MALPRHEKLNLVNQSITIFRDINVIARVANSTKKINVPKFKEFCKEAYIFKVQSFDWASLPVTQHRGYSHFADVIQLNDGIGLGDVSESCLESSHKILRFASKHLARQEDNLKNAYDCFNHLWFLSDPIVRSENESEEDSDDTEYDSELESDGDDALVQSFFISN